jgi:hypothetical protein
MVYSLDSLFSVALYNTLGHDHGLGLKRSQNHRLAAVCTNIWTSDVQNTKQEDQLEHSVTDLRVKR